MWDRLRPGSKYEPLSQAIIQAILSSKEVQARVEELHNQGALDGEEVIVLALRFLPQGGLEAKVELMRKSVEEGADMDVEEDEAPLEGNGEKPSSHLYVAMDRSAAAGRKMTPNEIAFEKYLQDRFDEDGWMKEVGIRFLSEEEKGITLREGESPEKESA